VAAESNQLFASTDALGLNSTPSIDEAAVSSQNVFATTNSPARGPNLFRKLFPWAAKGGLAIIDYGLFSGANFLLGVLLARWLSPLQYGAYALAFSIAILIGFFYQAILLEPLSVFSGTTFRDNLRGYLRTAVWIHWTICLLVCLILWMTALVTKVYGHSTVLASALCGIAVSAPFIMMHAFGRRAFYLKLAPGPAAFGSTLYFMMVMAGVFVVYRRGWLSPFMAFLVIGLASLVSATIMVFQLNARLETGAGPTNFRVTWGKHWEYGRWALATCVVGWIPNYVYVPLISSYSGMAAAGELRALMNLAAPVLQTYAALSMLFLPYAARLQRGRGRVEDSGLSLRLGLLFLAGAVAYWAVIIPLRVPIFLFLYAGKYVGSTYLIPLFALETIAWSASLGHAILLRAMESPRSLFVANSAASVVALALGIPATRFFGLRGVVWSMILANTSYSAVTFLLHQRKVSELRLLDEPLSAPQRAL
jgi:O-antigen/teichoic acid export membrane protein